MFCFYFRYINKSGWSKEKNEWKENKNFKEGLFSRECKCTHHNIVSLNGDVGGFYTLSSTTIIKKTGVG